ncbi:4-hydroxythreonine-4-phosphate dehydrogenase PdxA [Caldimonas caldifontis]|uniref:4-hydroxythreonine-4-phosphate dehydrogenase PdxA n=1 Tax=Caldimonas caldifontis TaxID=1452508 RepID=A0A2S5SSZ3_9BURK|nr:4-hydroxythreonine-4-phosphate dehydrogenase PdxA [Caldimonas caldifontis]PPE65860.1 4-hydroxythreonine-4-phosphate dehydrogenase PdxA [Caldimonas caldifontis]
MSSRDLHPLRPLALTLGDPCGIGPEILAMALTRGAVPGGFVVGDVAVMRRALACIGCSVPVVQIERPGEAVTMPPGGVPVLQPQGLPEGLASLPMGRVDAKAGAAAARCVREAMAWARRGEVVALVTAPLHKEALAAAGEPYPGHTELLQAEAAGPGEPPPPVRMMLANDEIRTVLVSIHVPLREAIERVTMPSVLETIRIAHRSAALWGQPQPRIAVAGLNPHAGEGGLFGDEEIRHIAPAIEAARAEGIDARGPCAPDTVFMRARHAPGHPGEFDVVVAMYHDQGLIPVKYLGVEQGVNVTLGLPFIRTSPDHGTAFDLAGTGRADPSSLIAAARMARRLSAGCSR